MLEFGYAQLRKVSLRFASKVSIERGECPLTFRQLHSLTLPQASFWGWRLPLGTSGGSAPCSMAPWGPLLDARFPIHSASANPLSPFQRSKPSLANITSSSTYLSTKSPTRPFPHLSLRTTSHSPINPKPHNPSLSGP